MKTKIAGSAKITANPDRALELVEQRLKQLEHWQSAAIEVTEPFSIGDVVTSIADAEAKHLGIVTGYERGLVAVCFDGEELPHMLSIRSLERPEARLSRTKFR